MRDDLRQNPSNLASLHLGLNLFSHTRSPKPASGVPNLRPLDRLKGVSRLLRPCWCKSLERRGVPSTLSDAGQHHGLPARFPQQLPSSFSRGPRQSRWLSQQSHCLQSPGGLILSAVVVASARSSRTRRMSSQMLGSTSVLTVTSWHPNPWIHFASNRAACGSPPPFIETAAANVMPVRLSFATNCGVESAQK